MAIAAETLAPAIPVFERAGVPSDAFPYPFVGYRPVPGVGADLARVSGGAGLAVDIAALFNRLHRIDPSRVRPTPDGWEREPWARLSAELAAVAEIVRPLLGPDLLPKAEPYLASQVSEPPQDGPLRFIHGDISPDHVIVDPDTGRLNGLIDFGDAMAGDPVLDFVGLIGIDGYRFISRVAAGYDLPLGDSFGARLEWLCRVLTLIWLADAVTHDPPSIAKHVSWVSRAFGC